MLPLRGFHREYFQIELDKDCNQRNKFFKNRIVNNWNSLPDEIVAATTTNVFKKDWMNFLNKKDCNSTTTTILVSANFFPNPYRTVL